MSNRDSFNAKFVSVFDGLFNNLSPLSVSRVLTSSDLTMGSATLLSLDDALLDRVLCRVVELCGLERTVATSCLVNRQIAALVRKPLAAWQTVCMRKRSLPSVTAASLARWLASVAPGVVELKFHLCAARCPPFQELALQPFLASSKMLKTLDLVMIHLLPVDLALLGLLTTLTTLRCECFLLEETQPLSRLASLSRLRQLDLTVVTAASGTQLPSSLSALTGLQTLQLRCRRNPLDWKSPAPRQQLPQAWCQAATQVTSVQLDHMDLPGIAGNRYSSNSGSRSWGNVIFPAMRDLHLVGPSDPCREALSRCQALKALKVEAADLGMAGWAALSALPQLGRLSVVHALLYEDADDDEGGQFFPVPGSLSALTSITFLHLRASAILPAIPQLPALQHVELACFDLFKGAEAGWPLPEGPWLNNLMHCA